MGSLKEKPFSEIWAGPEAERIRARVKACDQRCWMIGSVAPAMKKDIQTPARWVARAQLTSRLTGRVPPVKAPSDRPRQLRWPRSTTRGGTGA